MFTNWKNRVFCVLAVFVITNNIALPSEVDSLKQTNSELQFKIEHVNKRIDDLYTWLPIYTGLLILVLGGAYFMANNVAKRQAIKELKELKEQIDKLRDNADKVNKEFTELGTKINVMSEFQKGDLDE